MSLLAQRVVTAVVLASVAVVLILRFDNGVFAAFIGAFIVLAAREWAVLSGIRSIQQCLLIAGAMAVLLAGLFTLLTPAVQLLIGYLGLAWWLGALFWLRHAEWGRAGAPGVVVKLALGLPVLIPAWAISRHC